MLNSHDTVVACSIVTYELIRFRPSSNTPFAFEIPAILLTFGEKETELAETIIALIIGGLRVVAPSSTVVKFRESESEPLARSVRVRGPRPSVRPPPPSSSSIVAFRAN